MKDYYDKTEHLYEDSEHDPRPEFEHTFWKTCKAGMALQKQGKEARVNIG